MINSENGMITNGEELLILSQNLFLLENLPMMTFLYTIKMEYTGKDQKISVSYDQIQEYYNGEIEKRSLHS